MTPVTGGPNRRIDHLSTAFAGLEGALLHVLRFGRYRVLRHLGGGASSRVYLAEDVHLSRKVALKILREAADPSQIRRFEEEARWSTMLNHPNLVTILDLGGEGHERFIATEYVEGRTLRERLLSGPLPQLEAVDIAIGAARALAAAHEAWIVHRDIKPENVMLRPDRLVKVLDFGVATLASGAPAFDPLRRPVPMVGTLHYLSPEQVRGEPIIDTRSDIFSLGVVLYEMLRGEPPFRGEAAMDVLANIVEAEPEPLHHEIHPALRHLVRRMLEKSIYDRVQTAEEVVDELTDIHLDLALGERDRRRVKSEE